MSSFASLFGYILKFLYDIVGNYGVAIILFSILVKLVMLPLTVKQQKTLKKNEKLQKEMNNLQFKYKNDPEKLNQELMDLYKREGMSPFSGCLSAIIQIILLFSVFMLVRSPLTYMVKMDTDVIEKMEDIVAEQSDSSNTNYQEIAVIQYVKELASEDSVEESNNEEFEEVIEDNSEESEVETDNSENEQENEEEENSDDSGDEEDEETSGDDFNIYDYVDDANLNMDFLGIDLSQVPTQNLTDWKTLIIPVLYVLTSFISIKMTTATNKKKKEENKLITDGQEEKKEEEYNPAEETNKMMSWMMPILSISIAIIAPLGLALYWLMNNILMIIERIVLNKIFNKEEEAEKNA